MKIRTKSAAVAIAAFAGVAVLGSSAGAHHSFAMFDRAKEVPLTGTVKEFQWKNPHIWIQLIVTRAGKPVEYSIEGSSPNGLSRKGWNRNIFKPGDKVTVVINPLKSGEAGGSFVKATLADGKPLDR